MKEPNLRLSKYYKYVVYKYYLSSPSYTTKSITLDIAQFGKETLPSRSFHDRSACRQQSNVSTMLMLPLLSVTQL